MTAIELLQMLEGHTAGLAFRDMIRSDGPTDEIAALIGEWSSTATSDERFDAIRVITETDEAPRILRFVVDAMVPTALHDEDF